MALANWLHHHHHVSHRAMNAALTVVHRILADIAPQFFHPDISEPVRTLDGSIQRLQLKDTFLILPMCPSRYIIMPANPPADACCPKCSTLTYLNPEARIGTQKLRPALRLPFNALSSQLPSILTQDGMEGLATSRTYTRTYGRRYGRPCMEDTQSARWDFIF